MKKGRLRSHLPVRTLWCCNERCDAACCSACCSPNRSSLSCRSYKYTAPRDYLHSGCWLIETTSELPYIHSSCSKCWRHNTPAIYGINRWREEDDYIFLSCVLVRIVGSTGFSTFAHIYVRYYILYLMQFKHELKKISFFVKKIKLPSKMCRLND